MVGVGNGRAIGGGTQLRPGRRAGRRAARRRGARPRPARSPGSASASALREGEHVERDDVLLRAGPRGDRQRRAVPAQRRRRARRPGRPAGPGPSEPGAWALIVRLTSRSDYIQRRIGLAAVSMAPLRAASGPPSGARSISHAALEVRRRSAASRRAGQVAVERDEHDLLVVVERAAVEVRRADDRGDPVDRHHLRVHHRRLEGPDPHPALDQPRVDRLAGQLADPLVGVRARAAAGRPRRRGPAPRRGSRGSRRPARSTPSRCAAARGADSSMTWKADCMSSQPRLAEPRTTCTVERPVLRLLRELVVVVVERLAGLGPVLDERRLQAVDRRPLDAQVGVPPLVLVAGVAAPLLGDADAAGEADPAVDDADLAVQPVVGLERRLHQRLAEPLDLHAGRGPSGRPGSSRSAARRARR